MSDQEKPIVPKRSKMNLEETQVLFDLLQGNIPDDCVIPDSEVPRLSADQAWTVVWWLGNQYMEVSDNISRCDVCGDLYDSANSGFCLDFGDAPYHFCDSCEWSDAYAKKLEQCPDKFHKSPKDGDVCPTCCEQFDAPS